MPLYMEMRATTVALVARFGPELWLLYQEHRTELGAKCGPYEVRREIQGQLEKITRIGSRPGDEYVEVIVDKEIQRRRAMYSERFLELFDFHVKGVE